MEKGNGTQIIINVAGKQKSLGFSNKATAVAFIKGATAKFGSKFKMVAASFEYVIQVGDNQFVDIAPLRLTTLEEAHRFAEGDDITSLAVKVKNGIANGERVKIVPAHHAQSSAAPQQSIDNSNPTTSGMSDIDGGAPSFMEASKNSSKSPLCAHCNKPKSEHKKSKEGKLYCTGWSKVFLKKEDKSAGFNFSPSNVPSQVVQEFYPELQHELISYPNVTNAPMVNPEISGDMHELGTAPAEGIGEAVIQNKNLESLDGGELLPGALENAFDKLTVISYVSTSPAAGAGIGRDGKPQVLEGLPLRKENDIRGPMFTEEFYQNYQAVPGAALAALKEKTASEDELKELKKKRKRLNDRLWMQPRNSKEWKEIEKRLQETDEKIKALKKTAGADEKKQFALFLKRVMGEVAASFLAAFKVTSKMPMNKVPGVGEIQLAQIEQATNVAAFNIVNMGSRVKYLMEKLTDSEIQDAINDAFAQGAVWHDAKEGGFVYEVFVRAETIDTENLTLKYKFVTGTREADE